jgi:hypothetical protein
MVDLNDLFNLKNIITDAHLKLIEMFTIWYRRYNV